RCSGPGCSPRSTTTRSTKSLALEPSLQRTIGEHRLELLVAADQHATHEHLREGWVSAPQLDREALLPMLGVAAVLEVGELEASAAEAPAGLLDEGVCRHA